jgi:hypothetical protein
MTFSRFVRTTVGVAIFAMALRVSVDTDTWWHLRAGQTIEEEGHILLVDRFSLTRQGAEWHYPGWLAEILMYRVFAGAGYAGLNLATATLVAVAFGFVWASAEGPPLLRAFVVLLAATTSAVYWAARPHIFTFLLLSIFCWVSIRATRGRGGGLWTCIPMMVLWANLHGGFAAGILLLILGGVGEVFDAGMERLLPLRSDISHGWLQRTGAWAATAGGCLAAVAINPLGPELILYPVRTVSIGVLQTYIQEWQSPNFHQPEVLPFLVLLMATMVAMALSPRRPQGAEILWTIVFAALGLLAARNIALFAVVALPVLSRHLNALVGQMGLDRVRGKQVSNRWAQSINWMILAIVVFGTALKAVRPLSESFNRGALRRIAPFGAAEYLLTHLPPGPLFNTYNWGGYVVWSLYPSYLSFVDGRTDLFGDAILEEYLATWRADPQWRDVFAEWGIRLALLEPNAPLTRTLVAEGWQPVFQDELSVVLVNPQPP